MADWRVLDKWQFLLCIVKFLSPTMLFVSRSSVETIVFQAFKCAFEEHYNGPIQNISAILFQLYTLYFLAKYLILDF